MARPLLTTPLIAVLLLAGCSGERADLNSVESGVAVCDSPGVSQAQGGGPPIDPGLPSLESVELTAESGALRVIWRYGGLVPSAPPGTTILRYIRVFATREAFTKGVAEAFTLAIDEHGPGAGGGGSQMSGWSVQTSSFDTKPESTGTEPSVESGTISATFPADSLSQLQQPFWWYAQEDVVQVGLNDAGGSSRLCPGNGETRLVPDVPLAFPSGSQQTSAEREPDPTGVVPTEPPTTSEVPEPSPSPSTTPPSPSAALPTSPPAMVSESQAAEGLIRSWNESDPGAAASYAADDAVRFMFS